MMATAERQLFYDPPALSTLGRGIPGDLSDLVQLAMSKDPARRGSMRDLSDGLAVVLRRLQAARNEAAGGLLLQTFLPDLGPALAKTEPQMASFEEPPRSAVLPPEPAAVVKRPGPAPSTLRAALEPPVAWKPPVRTMPMEAMDRRTRSGGIGERAAREARRAEPPRAREDEARTGAGPVIRGLWRDELPIASDAETEVAPTSASRPPARAPGSRTAPPRSSSSCPSTSRSTCWPRTCPPER
jgi:hypothetical protein